MQSSLSSDRLCITQEFGTVNMYLVGKASIDEMYGYWYGRNAQEKQYYQNQYKDCFYVQTKEWKRKVVTRGLKTFIQVSIYDTI